MALVQRNLAALQKAEQAMRNPYKRQQVPEERQKLKSAILLNLKNFELARVDGMFFDVLCAIPSSYQSTSHSPSRGLASLKPSTIRKTILPHRKLHEMNQLKRFQIVEKEQQHWIWRAFALRVFVHA